LPLGELGTEESRKNLVQNLQDGIDNEVPHMDRTGRPFKAEKVVHGRVTMQKHYEIIEDERVATCTRAVVDLVQGAVFTDIDTYNVKLSLELSHRWAGDSPAEGMRQSRTMETRRLSGSQFEIISTADNEGRIIGFTATGN